jgi:hypothetical protein
MLWPEFGDEGMRLELSRRACGHRLLLLPDEQRFSAPTRMFD